MPETPSRILQVRGDFLPVFAGQPVLTPVRLSGEEGMNSLFCYQLVVATVGGADPDVPIGTHGVPIPRLPEPVDHRSFIGRSLTVEIELARYTRWVPPDDPDPEPLSREITGVVTDTCFLERVGRRDFYRLTLRPWLHLATLNRNTRCFQDCTVGEILETLLQPYPGATNLRLFTHYPPRDYQVQYQESDFAFFSRLCEEWGLNYHFSHRDGRHTLEVRDVFESALPMPGHAWRALDFHPPGHRLDAEYLHRLVAVTSMTADAFMSRDYAYTKPNIELDIRKGQYRGERFPLREVYDFQQLNHYAQPRAGIRNDAAAWTREGELLAGLRWDALACQGLRAQAEGHLRGMVPGHTFALRGHPDPSNDRQWLVLHARLDIQDTPQESQPSPSTQFGQHHRIDAVMELFPLGRDAPTYTPPLRTPRPAIHGIQIARVVGPAGQRIHTDDLGRIKVQFLWDRIGSADQGSSCWIRVMAASAGRGFGSIFLPRVGDEVAVIFVGGDPDLPMCIGSSRNAVGMPPYRLPQNQALAGHVSRELGGTRHNQLVFDDALHQMQVQLGSDQGGSQLALGRISRVEHPAGRQEPRGDGFELRTDGAGAVRAGGGLLFTTELRAGGADIVLSMGETLQRLLRAHGQHDRSAAVGRSATAYDADADQQAVAAAIASQNDELARFASATPPTGPDAAPHLLLASAAGIAATAAGSTHLASGVDAAITSGRHTSISAAGHLLASATGAIRLFAQKAGMRFIAAVADIDIEALQGKLKLLAKIDIALVAGRITITAQEEVVVNGGGSSTRWTAAGIEHATAGPYRIHSAGFSVAGPRNQPRALATPTVAAGPDHLVLSLASYAREGRPIANEPYEVLKGGAVFARGVTDEEGRIRIEGHEAGTTEYTVRTARGTHTVKVSQQLSDSVEERLGNRGYRDPKASVRGGNYPSSR